MVGLDVLIEIVQDFLKCYLWNVVWPTNPFYYDLSLGLATKAKACKGAGQEWSLGVIFHAPRNVGGCEGMNPHTLKWLPLMHPQTLW